MTPGRLRGVLLTATAVLAALVFLAWSQLWFTLSLTASSGDPLPLEVGGDVAASGLAPLALAVLAIVAALALAGRVFRMLFGVLEALLGVCIIVVALVSLGDPAASSAQAVTEVTGVSGADSIAQLIASVAVSGWPALAIGAGIGVVVVGVLVTATASRWPVSGRKYARTSPAETNASTRAPLASDPVAEWDALSEGDDPTASSR